MQFTIYRLIVLMRSELHKVPTLLLFLRLGLAPWFWLVKRGTYDGFQSEHKQKLEVCVIQYSYKVRFWLTTWSPVHTQDHNSPRKKTLLRMSVTAIDLLLNSCYTVATFAPYVCGKHCAICSCLVLAIRQSIYIAELNEGFSALPNF